MIAVTISISKMVGMTLNIARRSTDLDGGRAAIDGARQAAGLAVQMEAHRQRVQVLERLQRHHPAGALLHGGEHRVAQLAEARGGDAQQSVGDDQRRR